MKDLKDVKQVAVSYGMNSLFVKELVKTWTASNEVTLHDGFN